MDTPQNQFHPLDPDKDLFLFIDAPSISAEHRRGWVNDEARHSGRRRVHSGPRLLCHACRERAMWALLAFAGHARANGWSRNEALTYLEEHPAIYDHYAKEGIRRQEASHGRLAQPMKAAANSTYQEAIRAAANRGELDVPTAVATEVLGWVIRAVQDEFATPTGEVVEWNRLEADMDWDHETPAWVVWSQIVQACKKAPRAQKMLDKHVFSWPVHLAAPEVHDRDE